jgi:hypothetical protein
MQTVAEKKAQQGQSDSGKSTGYGMHRFAVAPMMDRIGMRPF